MRVIPEFHPMKQLAKVLLLFFVVVTVADLIGFLLPALRGKAIREKVVADVSEKLEAYVTTTHGRWPRSWDDLGLDEDDMGRYIELDFTLDPQTASVEDVARAIELTNQPHGMPWPLAVRYPQHVIDRVYLAICQARAKELEPSIGADSR